MLQLLVFYVALPFGLAALVLRFIKKYGASQVPSDVAAMLAVNPVDKRRYRAARRDEKGLFKLGADDFDAHEAAVDAIYAARQEWRDAGGKKAAFIVLDARGETLDWIDA